MDPLATAAELKTYVQRPINDAAAALAVAGASGEVRSHCGWVISAEQAVFEVAGNDTKILSLPTLRLRTVDSVTVNGVPFTDYTWASRGQLYRRAGVWPDFSRIVVTGLSGYDPIPDVVKVVVLAQAARYVGNPERFKTAAVGSVSRTFDLTELDEALLHQYRIFNST